MSVRAFRRILVPAAIALLFAGPPAGTASAQDGRVYAIGELSNPPKLVRTVQAARLIQESYPDDLKRRGVGGMVEIAFIVDATGKVDPSSVAVVDATQTRLGAAARKVVARLAFAPGKLDGASVKTKVVLPIIYKP